jgi:hypothetical protein
MNLYKIKKEYIFFEGYKSFDTYINYMMSLYSEDYNDIFSQYDQIYELVNKNIFILKLEDKNIKFPINKKICKILYDSKIYWVDEKYLDKL